MELSFIITTESRQFSNSANISGQIKLAAKAGAKYYAVRRGRDVGVFKNWETCKQSIHAYPGAVFKQFFIEEEAHRFAYRTREDKSLDKEIEKKLSRPIVKRTIAWTDGSCLSNGKSSAIAGWGVYYGDDNSNNKFGRLEGTVQSNQRAELYAVLTALQNAQAADAEKNDKIRKLEIRTDSEYTIKALTSWYQIWKRNGFQTSAKKPVQNLDLIDKARDILAELKSTGYKVRLKHVRGHFIEEGNIEADRLANKGALLDSK